MSKAKGPNEFEVHQAIFGYADGHQLIDSTTKFDADTLDALVRLTDGTGAEAVSAFDGYLSGFPLPDGRYALSRTYRDHPGSRPGAAMTKVLLLERKDVARISTLDELIFQLKRPVGDGKLRPVWVSGDSDSAAVTWRPRHWGAVVSTLFGRAEMPVVVTAKSCIEHEAAIVALWDWMWPSLRTDFAFCLGAVGTRKLHSKRSFDYLVIPESRSSAAHLADSFVVNPVETTIAGKAIADDIGSKPDSPLRGYVAFCGAESSRRSTVSLVTNVWLVARQADLDLDARQVAVAETVCRAFPSPKSMRRLKASIFAIDGRLSVRWDPSTSIELLAEQFVGEAVLSDDVPMRQLMLDSDEDPLHLLELASRVEAEHQMRGKGGGDIETVARSFGSIAEDVAIDRVVPGWLGKVLSIKPSAGAKVILGANYTDHADWARAFWDLDPSRQDSLSGEYVRLIRSKGKVARGPGSTKTAGWLAYFAPSTQAGLNWLASCHTSAASRRDALQDLVVAHEGPHAIDPRWRAAISASDLVEAGIKLASTASMDTAASMLFMLDPGAAMAVGAEVATWKRVPITSARCIEAAHLLRYSRKASFPSPDETRMICHSFAIVWSELADSNAMVWDALADYPAPPATGLEWDRAMRATASFAESVRGWPQPDVTSSALSIVAMVESYSRDAAAQLDKVLRSPARAPIPVRTPSRAAEKHGPSRLDSLRNIVDDILSAFR